MKIRIKGNSIRLRITQTEVQNFAKLGVLQESTELPGASLVYRLQQSKSIQQMTADFSANTLTVYIPEPMATQWVNSNEVGCAFNIPLSNGRELALLVEKDFVCLDNTAEDQSDNFPNPNTVC
ncbi:MAG: hypothetical protein EXR17_06605 [Flavobacteriaceae bacterium]|nr:hypothetical protein [Flavobacteriaceae bacterium]